MHTPLWPGLFLLLLTSHVFASNTRPNLGATTVPATKCASTLTLLSLVDCRYNRVFRLIQRARPVIPSKVQPEMM